jgi:hypothetical protein
MSRTITLLGLAQIATVVCGFFGLAIILKHHGYPGEPFQVGFSFAIDHWSRLALFLRCHGLILLVVPLAWIVLAGISEHRANFILPFGLWLMVGTIIPFVIIMTFFYAIFHPCVAVPN